MKKVFLSLMLMLPFTLIGADKAENLRFPYNPTLSPDAQEIYFSYDGDIFKVSANGGTALRFVSLGANENYPVVSPDGKLLAFSSNVNGNNDVYIVSTKGGEVTRLTWHEQGDNPVAWSADSKYVYFESTRANNKTTYKVSVNGGTPVRLFDGYFNTISNVEVNPVTGEIYFNESNESIKFQTRKRYVGDHNSDIKSWNPKTKEYRQLTTYIGKDTWPMVDKNGTLYYISDEYNKESNIVKYNPNGKGEQMTKYKQSIQYPSISFDGSKIVFLLNYEIMCMDTKTGKVEKPFISIADNNIEMVRQFSNQAPRYSAVSPDGKKLAHSIRGLLYVSDAQGEYLQLLDTPKDERVNEIVWTDNKTLYYTRTNKGYMNIYKIKADGSAPEKLVYQTPCNVKSLTLSHKRDKIAFVNGSKEIRVVYVNSDKTEKVTDAEFWSFNSYSLNFSFDDSHLAFEAMHLFEGEIYIYSFADKKLHNLTNSASAEDSPVFSPDGKTLFFAGNLYSSSFPRGTSYGRSNTYRLPLQRYDNRPFKSDVYDNLFKEEVKKDEKKDAKKDAKKEVKEPAEKMDINYDDIYRRIKRMPEYCSNMFAYRSNGTDWLLYQSGGNVKCLNLSDPEAQPMTIRGVDGWGRFTSSDHNPYFMSGANIYRLNLGRMSASKVTIRQDVEKNLDDEFAQILYEGWGIMDQNFYDVNFHGADWKGKIDYYASFLPYVRTREHLRTLFNDMLGELNSSHLGFTSRGNEEYRPQIRTYSAETGIIWNNENPYVIDRILTDSPANSVDFDIQPGDKVVAINGVKVNEKENREKLLSSNSPVNEVKFTVDRNGKQHDVKLHTISSGSVKNMLYTEWEDNCRARVDEKTNGRVGYIHLRDMTDGSLSPFLMAMHTDIVHRDALILDLRYNNGGNVHKEVLDFLRQKQHFRWSYRDFETNSHPNVTPGDKPIVVLVNERSLSDAEVTSNGIKSLGIAKIVGTETYRWIIFTSSVSFLDGSSSRMPAWGCYSLDGNDLEHTGVKPDIYVKNTFTDRMYGKDPQLDTAIQEILRQLGK